MELFPPSVESLIEADDLCRVVNDRAVGDRGVGLVTIDPPTV